MYLPNYSFHFRVIWFFARDFFHSLPPYLKTNLDLVFTCSICLFKIGFEKVHFLHFVEHFYVALFSPDLFILIINYDHVIYYSNIHIGLYHRRHFFLMSTRFFSKSQNVFQNIWLSFRITFLKYNTATITEPLIFGYIHILHTAQLLLNGFHIPCLYMI